MSTYLITGASSGLGLQVALRLARQGKHRLILPLRNIARGEELRQKLIASGAVDVSTPMMDLSSLRSVSQFLQLFNSNFGTKLNGVLLNAGGQSANQLEFTVDGFETTFAVNHLAHFFLLKGLLKSLADQAFVGWTASGTHDPKETSARLSGFRGAQYTTAGRLARGDFGQDISIMQACKDAYATSKLCEIVSARIFAERHPQAARFFSFDPGLMPGTGLARKQGKAAQWIWRKVLPRLAAILPGTSTTMKSSAVLTDLLTGSLLGSYSGAYFNYTGKQIEPAALATERWVADDLLSGSDALLAPFV
jgi:NAD(P)-dependent dehydrogenase (short-subunit alcohol dehydrogenase family)